MPSICLNSARREFGGRCHLRFDDTNPAKEEQEYIDAIEADVRWLGFDWGKNCFMPRTISSGCRMGRSIDQGRQGLCRRPDAGRNASETRHPDRARQNSPFRVRTVDENLDLFRRMKAGEFPNGARVLRPDDMASGINLRDPTLYRIVKAPHPRTGTTWSIYPSYDFAHGQSDAIEGITHSICTLSSRITGRSTTGS